MRGRECAQPAYRACTEGWTTPASESCGNQGTGMALLHTPRAPAKMVVPTVTKSEARAPVLPNSVQVAPSSHDRNVLPDSVPATRHEPLDASEVTPQQSPVATGTQVAPPSSDRYT